MSEIVAKNIIVSLEILFLQKIVLGRLAILSHVQGILYP